MAYKDSNQNGFTRTNFPEKGLGGFIPMIIMIVIVIAVFIWLVYSRVSSSH